MKKLFILFLLFTTFKGITQSCKGPVPPSIIKHPKGGIASTLRQTRIDLYTLKNEGERHIKSISYNPCGFLHLLNSVSGRGYDGLRVYFASTASRNGKLTLVFVPTIEIIIDDYRAHLDDLEACYVIDNSISHTISARDASELVRNFKNDQERDFTFNGENRYRNERINKPFFETSATWYDISLIKPGTDLSDGTTGLSSYLQYLIDKDSVDNVIVEFGGFERQSRDLYYYQLSPIFNFAKAGAPIKTVFGIQIEEDKKTLIDFADKRKPFNQAVDMAIRNVIKENSYADTGVPCPPPPTGSTCPGASLPLP
jgi:hypothetical protein